MLIEISQIQLNLIAKNLSIEINKYPIYSSSLLLSVPLKMKFTPFIKSAAIFLLFLNAISVNAQKRQKDIQENSVFVSVPIKIDGKLNDWKDTLQAFNRTTSLGYTIANDEKNIYLVIKSADAANNNKILAGGITFTINTEGKKKDTEAFIVTFPVINTAARPQGQRGQGVPGGQRQQGQVQRQSQGTDASAIERRKQQLAQFKEIKVFGFNEITDSLISIYNEYGIKVATSFDTKGNFIYELAVPLKSLDLKTDNKNELSYNIKINGRQFGGRGFGGGFGANQAGGFGDGGGRGGAGGGFGAYQGGENRANISIADPVDFWGKYSLARQ